MKKIQEIAESFYVIFSLTFFSGAMFIIFPEQIIPLFRYFIWGVATIVMFLYWKKAIATIKRDIFIWILTLIILLSFIWSVFPDVTLKFMGEVWQMSMFALYFATRFTLKKQVKLVALTYLIGALLSAFYAVFIPGIGMHWADHPGAWRGVYDYKNTLGSMMVLGSVAFFSLPTDKPKHPLYRLYKWGGFSICLLVMSLSTSKTSLVLSFLLISILTFYRHFRWRGKVSVIFLDIGILILGCVAIVVLSEWVVLLSGLGKDPTLTGRTLIWGVALARLQQRPLFGYGRGAFWSEGSPYAAEAGKAVTAIGFIPPHGHNGFIDLAIDVGWIGLSLFMASYAIAYFRALKQAYVAKNPEDMWPLAFLLFLAMNNVTESYLLRQSNVYWVMYLTIALSVRQKGD
ncbi:MAG: O-antigen ligase family protein [Stigonema ocellatum SAG 48.90 = DSM 106950]|nr:O-antigen ligase family protein [Stigonema ocellatum SAG 48.90 = DSM 106950]